MVKLWSICLTYLHYCRLLYTFCISDIFQWVLQQFYFVFVQADHFYNLITSYISSYDSILVYCVFSRRLLSTTNNGTFRSLDPFSLTRLMGTPGWKVAMINVFCALCEYRRLLTHKLPPDCSSSDQQLSL